MSHKDTGGYINNVSEGEIIAELKLMEINPKYQTSRFYRGSSHRWTNNYISFIEHHLNYLKTHPRLEPEKYISNLRLKLRK